MTELPAGWTTAALGDIISIRNGYAFKSADFCKEGIPVVRQSNLTGNLVDLSDCVYVPSTIGKQASNFVIKRGDLILGMSGSIGEPSVYPYDFDALQNQRTGLIRFYINDEAHRKFIKQALIFFEKEYVSRGKGLGVQNVSAQDIEKTLVLLPPLSEQRRIAVKIDSLSAKSSRARDNLDHIPRLVEKYKQAILAAAFKGQLTREWRSARMLQEARPARLGELLAAPIRNGLSVRGSETPPGVRALRLSALRGERVDLSDVRYLPISEDRAERYLLKEGDVLVSRGNGTKAFVGRAALVGPLPQPTIFPDTAFRLRLNEALARPTWIARIWNAEPMRRQIELAARTTAGIWKISQADLNQLQLILPCPSEQDEISNQLDTMLTWINRLATEATSARKLIDHLDQAILAKAFRGELVPQDPNDEPASVLLERIRGEQFVGRGGSRLAMRNVQKI